jgi:folate-binding protein YgfZ
VTTEFRQDVTNSGSGVRAKSVGREAADIRRIEAGIPWSGREITEEYLPAETNQMARAVANQKGCYLGQEIVERMRARGALARKLSGIRCEGDAVPPGGAQVLDNAGKTVGTVTSACRSLALDRPVALAYLKTAATSPGAAVQVAWEGGIQPATVTELPFVGLAFA